MSDPVILAATIVLSELEAWDRAQVLGPRLAMTIERSASMERARINLQNAIDAHEAIENWMASDRGGRL